MKDKQKQKMEFLYREVINNTVNKLKIKYPDKGEYWNRLEEVKYKLQKNRNGLII